jgi:hydrogenase maturation protein HypF
MSPGRHIEIRGVVQGVGFRPWVYRLARTAGVTGSVSNGAVGVVIDAFAAADGALDAFVARLQEEPPQAARIERLSWTPMAVAQAPRSFEIVESSGQGERRPSIPADLATCDACLREVSDPHDRRHRYAFTSCTHCGPRFTIALDVPYDRATTTMAPFPMCADCLREYENPGDRRFHAQPNACSRCGPSLRLVDAGGRPVPGDEAEGDAIARTAALLVRGAIVAVKGLGGWHLACDASRGATVVELRRRKEREDKPFALMVPDLRAAEQLVELGDAGRSLLLSPARPIVVAPRHIGAGGVATAVAPEGNRLGLMLPYTPLHHVLMGDVARTLVMTSGNRSDEPIACDDDDAFERLGHIADAFLVHDRAIATRADDSVAFVALGRPVVTRRSRGYVPGRVTLARPLALPTLGCGAQLKNTFCLGAGDSAYLGPHVGDLDDVTAYDGYEHAIERMERFLRVRPEVFAHDLHPDYLSTRYAIDRALRGDGSMRVAVQHHHAHVASALVEHGLEGPVIGVTFDGSGHGTDGTSWGGEILVADVARFERVASLRGLRLAGGDRAVKDVWRTALALLDDAFDGDPPVNRLSLFDGVSRSEIAVVRRMLAAGVNAPVTSGAGRYFDAFGALGLGRPRASFEGQVAMAWEQAADVAETRPYPFAVDTGQPVWRIDLRLTARAAVGDLLSGRPVPGIAARFHETLAAATADVVRMIVRARGAMPVVLTGGCFQNVRLTESLARVLGADLTVLVHGQVPPGDGGVALGQLAVADAVLRDPRPQGGVPCASAFPEK